MWRTSRHEAHRYGVVGRKDVAQRIGARVSCSGPYTSALWLALASDAPGSPIDLLAVYLRAYSQIVPVD